MLGHPIHILLVEDDEVEAEAVLRAVHKHKLTTVVTVVTDGIEALKVLDQKPNGTPHVHPHVILLDLNMPRMNGLEFLDAIRQDVCLRRHIVFVLTTSNREEDKLAAYDRQVAGYLVKSHMGEDFAQLTHLLELYSQIIEFPPEPASSTTRRV